MEWTEQHAANLRALIAQIAPVISPEEIEPLAEQFQQQVTAAADADVQQEFLVHLDRESSACFGQTFADMNPGQRDEILERLESGNTRVQWMDNALDLFHDWIENVARNVPPEKIAWRIAE